MKPHIIEWFDGIAKKIFYKSIYKDFVPKSVLTHTKRDANFFKIRDTQHAKKYYKTHSWFSKFTGISQNLIIDMEIKNFHRQCRIL